MALQITDCREQRLWGAAAVVLILIAYGPFFVTYIPQFVSPGYSFW